MSKKEFIDSIITTLHECPEWQEDAIQAICTGVNLRLQEEIAFRADAETALCMCYDAASSSLSPAHATMVRRALCDSKMFGGTNFAKKLEEELGHC